MDSGHKKRAPPAPDDAQVSPWREFLRKPIDAARKVFLQRSLACGAVSEVGGSTETESRLAKALTGEKPVGVIFTKSLHGDSISENATQVITKKRRVIVKTRKRTR